MFTRQEIQNAFIRVCKDSNWTMNGFDAAIFTAKMLNIPALQIGFDFPSLSVMQQIAKGEHPICKKV